MNVIAILQYSLIVSHLLTIKAHIIRLPAWLNWTVYLFFNLTRYHFPTISVLVVILKM